MKVKLNKSVKGMDDGKKTNWPKDQIFDESKGDKIPRDIMVEIAAKSPVVTILHDANTPSSEEAGDIEEMQAQLDSANAVDVALQEDVMALKDENDALKETQQDLYEQLATATKTKEEAPPAEIGAPETTMIPCPVTGCDRTFKNEQGLKVHLTKAHPDFVYIPDGE